ncbi:MAG: patatin-like phospholipase family protein [Gammaproteobacteria bacterium]|nr:MAG: patatin-like phospholipase family protein [Gammaproteobacteria bacterium]
MSVENLTRRKFLTRLTATTAVFPVIASMASDQTPSNIKKQHNKPKKIGIALGAGGAKGLAHIPMLEVLDEMGIRPHMIAGSSMGAVIGGLYASGLSGKDIRQFIDKLVVTDHETWPEALLRKDLLKWIDFIAPELGSGGLINGEHFIRYLHTAIHGSRFDELKIPLKVVTADFWERKQVVLESGDLLPALKASMAMPGLFAPVTLNDRVLVDGGMVNPVPYDLLFDDCDIVIAIDVMGSTSPENSAKPSFFDAIFNSVHIMQQAILNEKMKHRRPNIYVKPAITGIRTLEFFEAKIIYKKAESARKQLKHDLGQLLI